MRRLLIMGPPGAGKGTQAALIKDYYKIVHISTGDMFRKAMKNETPLGRLAKEYIDKGELVPDSVTISLVRERLQEEDCEKGFLLDGFPRTIAQAIALDDLLSELNIKIDKVINIQVPDEDLISRITGRRVCLNCGASYHVANQPSKVDGICDNCHGLLYQRDDDSEETIKNRLVVYNSQTKPLLEYYKNSGTLESINGTGTVEEIFDRIKDTLGEN